MMTKRDEQTADYYERCAGDFAEATSAIDPEPFLGGFARALAPSSRVLDLGCGSGRDLLWFKERGHRPAGLERSQALARFAESHSGCPVVVGDLLTTPLLDEIWDAILISGVLVHLSPSEVRNALLRAFSALSKGGHLYVSVKEGHGIFRDADGRLFYYWLDADFRREVETVGFRVVSMDRSRSQRRGADIWLGYLLTVS